MIYIIAYILLGISTGVWVILATKERGASIVSSLVWPLVWIAYVVQLLRNKFPPCNCAWCGKTVAPLNGDMKIWSDHYLNECEKHPLAIKAKRLENYLDELDSRNTANRVRAEALEAELKPYREMTREIERRQKELTNRFLLKGEG